MVYETIRNKIDTAKKECCVVRWTAFKRNRFGEKYSPCIQGN